MGPEGGAGSAPEEAQEEVREEPRPRFRERLGRFFGRRQNNEAGSRQDEVEMAPGSIDDIQEARREQAEAQAEANRYQRTLNPERLEIPNEPEDLVNLMTVLDGVAWRERKLDEKYKGGRMGAIRKFLAGERDFSLDQNGQTRHKAWNEFKRKALKVGISTAVSTTVAVGIGAATGGVGLLAFGAIFGSTLAHGAVEAMHSLTGKERGLREKIARAQWEQWAVMHQDALDSQTETEQQKKNQLLEGIINNYYGQSEEILGLGKELRAENKVWNKRRMIGKLVGGLAGAGITFGLAHLGERVMTMDINGDHIAHLVERVNGAWHFAYNTSSEIAKAASQGAQLVADGLGRASHVLGESGWQVALGVAKNLAPTAGGLMGAVFQRGYEKIFKEPSEEKMNKEQAKQEEFYQERKAFLKGQLPEIPGGGGGEGVSTEPLETTPPNQYVELAREENKGLPEVGKTWIYPDVGGMGILKIKNIDWETGRVTVDKLDQAFGRTGEEYGLGLDELIKKGYEKSEFVNDWLLTVSDGGKVRIGAEQKILDRSDPQSQRLVAAEDYNLRRIKEKPGVAELVKEGQEKQRVNIFDLAFWGVRPLEPEKKTEEKVKAPKPKEIWQRKPDAGDLPPEFQGMQDKITITDVEDGIIYFRDGDRPIEDIKLFVRYFRKVGGGGGGGQQEGGGQRGRGGRERT